ncbi:MAG: anti-sigma factor [Saprospiraceae bacterium]
MNKQAYISSGILEEFAMGMLSATEAKEVADNVAKYPELASELASINESLTYFVQSVAKTPPQGLEDKIWTAIQAEPISESKPIVKQLEPKMLKGGWIIQPWLAAASIMFMVLSSALSAYYYFKYTDSNEALVAMQSEKDQMASDFEAQQASYDLLQHDLQVVTKPSTKMVVMQGLPEFPDAKATIFWDQASSTVMLKVNQLPKVPTGKQYQLWAIVDGKAIDAGVFDLPESSDTMIKMKEFATASAFAITLEDKGGKPKAEGAMYVLGSI